MNALPCFVALLLFGQLSESPGEVRSSRFATIDGNPILQPAKIVVRDEVRIPAPEPGTLIELSVREGARVTKGDVLARIDDREAKATVTVTKYAEQAAIERAKQDIEERYAQAAAEVAEAEWKKDLEANRMQKGAVAGSEVERKKLDFKRATLQIEKAANDRIMATYDAKTKRAERRAAEMALDWRTIRAPFDGDVVKTFVHQSEWVNPGEPILRLMRFDKLYVEGFLRAKDFDRSEVLDKPVTVEVTKARGRTATVAGRIVYVDQTLQGTGGIYSVRAEVENEQENGSWLLQPGSNAKMTIHLDSSDPQSEISSTR